MSLRWHDMMELIIVRGGAGKQGTPVAEPAERRGKFPRRIPAGRFLCSLYLYNGLPRRLRLLAMTNDSFAMGCS
jgi:hypothetical protein